MPNPVWSVVDVTPQKDYTLLLTFEDGKKGLYDARQFLKEEIVEPLRSLPFFLSARAEDGTVVWNDDLDIAPEHLYESYVPVAEPAAFRTTQRIRLWFSTNW